MFFIARRAELLRSWRRSIFAIIAEIMKQHSVRLLLAICASLSCMVAASPAFSAIAEARLVGLALHQETGRNIYIGAIHYNQLVPRPDDLVGASGPKAMEYRVVARRTSIRSLMGSILLQGELATERPPSASTIEFAGKIMAAVKGSLYAGDSLEIGLNADDSIIATLNGHELARTSIREVSDYLLLGWVGERGPSTAFRGSILASKIDNSLMSIYSAHTVSDERLATIGTWFEVAEQVEPEQAPANSPEESALANTVEPTPEVNTLQGSKSEALEEVLALNDSTAIETSEPLSIGIVESTEEAPLDEPVLFASLTLTNDMIQPQSEDLNAVAVFDAIEYSQRLSSFNSQILRSVYARISYPRAAVRRNVQGTLELDVSVDIDGNLMAVTVARPSGHSLLDKSAVQAATKAFSDAPLTPIDSVAIAEYSEDGSMLVIPIPISFILTE